jgi:hypothetical protein
MARKGNPGKLKLIRDDDSSTGLSAAILLRNVRPGRLNNDGGQLIAKSEFMANFSVNLGGHRVRPRVAVMVYAQLTDEQIGKTRAKERLERAMQKAPMLT